MLTDKFIALPNKISVQILTKYYLGNKFKKDYTCGARCTYGGERRKNHTGVGQKSLNILGFTLVEG